MAKPKKPAPKAKAKTKAVAKVEAVKVAPKKEKPDRPVIELGDMEKLLVQGDLSSLNEGQRIDYYKKVCLLMGLNPLTRPFEYITFWEKKKVKGEETWASKLMLYATRNCTDQLCGNRKISTEIIRHEERSSGVYVVWARASMPDGRKSEAMGVTTTSGQSGNYLANAMMKAETKAKRRAVLSLCGLSFMDEAEVEDLPVQARVTTGADAVAALEAKHLDETGRMGPSVKAIEHKTEPEVNFASSREAEVTTLSPGRKVPGVPAGHGISPELKREMDRHPNAPPPEDRGSISKGDDHRVADDEEVDPDTGEVLPKKAAAKNSAGVLYPAPPENVITMLKQGRYMPWLLWIETDGFFDKFKPTGVAAFKKDFAAAIRMAHDYGSSHWARVVAAFDKSDDPFNE